MQATARRLPVVSATASLTGGFCMPCSKGTRRDPIPRQVWISVRVDDVVFRVRGQDLLPALEQIGPIGGEPQPGRPDHPNRYEMAALIALVRHALHHKIDWTLNCDHWNRAGYACYKLFEDRQAVLVTPSREYEFDHIQKTDWIEGTEPLAQRGGFAYLDENGAEIYRRWTWIS